jgi:hypothetical protein
MEIRTKSFGAACNNFLTVKVIHEGAQIETDFDLFKKEERKEIYNMIDNLLTSLQSQFGEREVRKEIFDRMGWKERESEDGK